MNKEYRVFLADMIKRLQARMNYINPKDAFNTLLICFGKKKRHKTGWAGLIKRKGWMSPYIAHEFAEYVGYPIDKN